VHAIAALAQEEQSDIVASAYGVSDLAFGPEYLIPRPFDPRLMIRIAPAVAQAAMACGVATRPIADLDAYRTQLQQFVWHSGTFMKPIFATAKAAHRSGGRSRIVFAEGEDERVLRAVQVAIDEQIARPIVIGRPAVVGHRLEKHGLRMRPGQDFDLINPESDARYRDFWQTYHQMAARKGVTEQYARLEMRRRHTLIGSMMIHKGEADGMICGTFGTHALHLHYVDRVIGKRPGASVYGAMNILMLPGRQVAIVDTHVNVDPTAEQLAELTIMAAEEMVRFGLAPRAALLSHSNFGSSDAPSAVKMRQTLELLRERAPDLPVDGEMHADCALDESLRRAIMPFSTLSGEANLLVCPGIDAANISYNLLKTTAGNNVAIGPILLGAAKPLHILTASATVRRIVNMTALVVLAANSPRQPSLPLR
jgi:malate dehydrogenase (oxaloacetate-decarboxylating)(NADP+)